MKVSEVHALQSPVKALLHALLEKAERAPSLCWLMVLVAIRNLHAVVKVLPIHCGRQGSLTSQVL